MKAKGYRLLITELVLVIVLTLLNIVYNVSSKSYKFFAASDWKEIPSHPDDMDVIELADLFSMDEQEETPAPADNAAPAPAAKTAITPPMFLGQDYSTFGDWLAGHVEYPDEAADNNLFGVVHVSFVVDKDGSLTEVKIVRSIDPLLDSEVLRVVGQSPSWTPATAGGKPVSVRLKFTVDFSLEDE